MRWVAWLTLGICCELAAGCSGGYPLPPTRCDDYCDATKGQFCEAYYQPAQCVASCERMHFDAEACRAELDATVGCFRSTPGAVEAQCQFTGQARPCDLESAALASCVALRAPTTEAPEANQRHAPE